MKCGATYGILQQPGPQRETLFLEGEKQKEQNQKSIFKN